MLKHLQKFFATQVANPAPADHHKEVTEMTHPTQTAPAAPELAAQLASALEAMASQAEALQAVTGKLAEVQAQFEIAQAALDAVNAAKELLVAEKKAARLAVRKEAVVAAVGTDKAEALLSATDALDDASFQAVVGAMTTSLTKEAKSVLFVEVGVSAVADVPDVAAVEEESAEMQLLKAKYQTKVNKGNK